MASFKLVGLWRQFCFCLKLGCIVSVLSLNEDHTLGLFRKQTGVVWVLLYSI